MSSASGSDGNQRSQRMWEPLRDWHSPSASMTKIEASSPVGCPPRQRTANSCRSEEHTSELQSLMRSSYAVFCLKKDIISLASYILPDSSHFSVRANTVSRPVIKLHYNTYSIS